MNGTIEENETPDQGGSETDTPHAEEKDTSNETGEKTSQEQEIDPRVSAANREAASYRVKLREQEKQNAELAEKYQQLVNGLASLTGAETEQADPQEQLKAALAERDSANQRIREMTITQNVQMASEKHNADASLLIPFLKGSGKLDTLNPEDADYASQVETLVSDTVKAFPQVKKAAQAVPNSSGQPNNPNPDRSDESLTREDLARLQAAGNWAAINQAAANGRIHY